MRQLLKDLAVICAGQGAPQGDNNYCENGTPFVKAGNLQELLEGKAITSIQKVSDEVAKKHKLKLYPKGTILFAKSGMSCMKGYVYVLPQSAYVVSHLACVTPNEDASEYLRYFFNYHKPNQLVKDAAYPSISLSDIGNLVVDMKSESERNAIVSVLQHAESVITLRQKELQKLDDLVKARFVEMFGNRSDPEEELIDLIIDGAGLSYGIVQPGEDGTGDMGVLRPVDMVDGKIATTSIKYIDRSIGDGFKKTELTGDELLITVRGTTGITALTDERFKKMNVTRGIAVVRYDRNKINPVYLNAFLNADESQRYIQEHTRGATLQQINLSDLRVQKITVPPMELQVRFAAFAEQSDKSKLAVQQSLDKLELLKKALMQKYFG